MNPLTILVSLAALPALAQAASFVSPTGIPASYPSGLLELYRNQTDACLTLRPQLGSSRRVVEGWTGGLDACVKECTYDSRCRGVEYSEEHRTCTKMARPEVTDTGVPGTRRPFQAFRTDQIIPYLQQHCAVYMPGRSCDADPVCKTNHGRVGYNQLSHLKQNGGFCGRTKCTGGLVLGRPRKRGRKRRRRRRKKGLIF
jgi:hypothetical protein